MSLNRQLFEIEQTYAYVVLFLLVLRFAYARFRKESGYGWIFYTAFTLLFPFGLGIISGLK